MKFPYTEKVFRTFRNPKNVGKLEDADGKGLKVVPLWRYGCSIP
jgi:NifU-like protein involved in Fe-S cluster formation